MSVISPADRQLWDMMPNWKKRGCIENIINTLKRNKSLSEKKLNKLIDQKINNCGAGLRFKEIILEEANEHVNKDWQVYYPDLKNKYPYDE